MGFIVSLNSGIVQSLSLPLVYRSVYLECVLKSIIQGNAGQKIVVFTVVAIVGETLMSHFLKFQR